MTTRAFALFLFVIIQQQGMAASGPRGVAALRPADVATQLKSRLLDLSAEMVQIRMAYACAEDGALLESYRSNATTAAFRSQLALGVYSEMEALLQPELNRWDSAARGVVNLGQYQYRAVDADFFGSIHKTLQESVFIHHGLKAPWHQSYSYGSGDRKNHYPNVNFITESRVVLGELKELMMEEGFQRLRSEIQEERNNFIKHKERLKSGSFLVRCLGALLPYSDPCAE